MSESEQAVQIERFVVTNFRIRPEHSTALAEKAAERKRNRGGIGKADASEVLRDILDEWLRPATSFRDGDLVQMKSGGPIMCVARSAGHSMLCRWSHEGQIRDANFGRHEIQPAQ